MLNDRHELHESASDISQKHVCLKPSPLAGMVHRGHRVEFHPLTLDDVQSVHHPVECRKASLVFPVAVVDVFGPVQ